MRNDHLRSNTRMPRPIHRGDARSGAWGLAVLAAFSAATALGGCVSDPDCGVCDPENLILETVAGVNYAGKIVKLLGPQCEGNDCPGELTKGNYFVEKIIPCVETEEALKSPRGVDEWCRVSPLIVNDGLQFIFNNLLDPQSVELVRKSPVNPQLFEVYDWRSRIVHLEGPIARYNGDYFRATSQSSPDRMTRSVSLSCIDNLADQGVAFDQSSVNMNVCDGTFEADGKTIPLKMRLNQMVNSRNGETDARQAAQSCTPPQEGVDTCCDVCDYELSVNVAKYGVTQPLPEMSEATFDQKRSPNANTAIKCDLMGDKFVDCRDFIPHVDRTHEVRKFSYDWNGDGKVADDGSETFRVPMQDKLRETHPDQRPAGYEQKTVPCDTAQDCSDPTGPNLPGMDCVGTKDGQACSAEDPTCLNKRCVAEWFVDCRADKDTTGTQGYCVDKRWNGQGVAACFTAKSDYAICTDAECMAQASDGAGNRFAYADADTNNFISSKEGCRPELGGSDGLAGQTCDPYSQPGLVPTARYDRKETLPSTTRKCICEDTPAEGCADLVARLCHVDGDAAKPLIPEKKGQYALKFISRNGGVIYDPAIKGVLFLPADLGGMPRSFVENCSAGRAKGAGGLNIKDGWRANDLGFEVFENFDRSMCSSSTYKVKFEEPGSANALQYIRDKVGNTLLGKSTYVLKTPDFHVVPGSGFPTDNPRIGACDDFEIRFSNKYDMSPVNVNKLVIREYQVSKCGVTEGEVAGAVVAGGQGCVKTKEELASNPNAVPCLTVNVRDQEIGAIRVEIDSKEFGAVLRPCTDTTAVHYRLEVPGMNLAEGEDVYAAMKNRPDEYKAAFWDACGMPLVLSMPKLDKAGKVTGVDPNAAPDYVYEFRIDAPKCKEDQDLDGFQFSCDNAPNNANPDQLDTDADGFGDVYDLCPTLPSDVNTADTDKDGVGNDCDRCTRGLTAYNKNSSDANAPAYLLIRNIPDNSDYDGDGIGDVCDNCIVRSNCGEWGNDDPDKDPAKLGDRVPFDNDNICQVDNDMVPFIGDECIQNGMPVQIQGAAGPVGFGPMDDFDQDGVANMADLCPRQRVKACQMDAECGGEVKCNAGFCANHVDTDNDGVGDACDSCPQVANPKQIQEGAMQDDDPDGDYVGNACETNSECYDRFDPRPITFYSKVAPSGMCCTTLFKENTIDAPRLSANGEPLTREEVEALLMDYDARLSEWNMTMVGDKPTPPLFVPLKADCAGETPDKCRQLPDKVKMLPGIVDLPAGCDGAGEPLTLESAMINGNADELYKYMCTLPQYDQDFDGIGDTCDLCKFAFDPDNELFKDQNNKVWPSNGKYCSGEWNPEVAPRLFSQCGDVSEDMGGTGGDTDTGGSGGSSG